MNIFEWDEALFSVHIKQFDEHHKKLIQLMNKLYTHVIEGKGKDVLLPVLLEMKDYTYYHMVAEEKMLQDIGYPDLDNHKKAHDELFIQVDTLLAKYKDQREGLSIEVLFTMKTWLTRHILIEDRKYCVFIAEKEKELKC